MNLSLARDDLHSAAVAGLEQHFPGLGSRLASGCAAGCGRSVRRGATGAGTGCSGCTRLRVWQPNIRVSRPGSDGGAGPVAGRRKPRIGAFYSTFSRTVRPALNGRADASPACGLLFTPVRNACDQAQQRPQIPARHRLELEIEPRLSQKMRQAPLRGTSLAADTTGVSAGRATNAEGGSM